MPVSRFDEEAVRRIVAATAAVDRDQKTLASQVLELQKWIVADESPTGESFSNLLGAFLTVTSRLGSMTAGALSAVGAAQDPPGPPVDAAAVLRELEDSIALSRDKWERRN